MREIIRQTQYTGLNDNIVMGVHNCFKIYILYKVFKNYSFDIILK